jgi:lambda repressor-like predicted transcriptional regulator
MISTTSVELAVPSPVAESVLVKTDSKGRLRASKEQRRAVLSQYERSGMSAAKFSRVAGLKYSTLAIPNESILTGDTPRPLPVIAADSAICRRKVFSFCSNP